MLIGKKGNNPGIVYAPYIINTTPEIVESNFSPRMTLKSRYSTTTWRRKSRIEKIYKIEKPTEE